MSGFPAGQRSQSHGGIDRAEDNRAPQTTRGPESAVEDRTHSLRSESRSGGTRRRRSARIAAPFLIGAALALAPTPAAPQFGFDFSNILLKTADDEDEATKSPEAEAPYDPSQPVALIESIAAAPDADVEMFDYVYIDQTVDLGAEGVAVLAYFDSCVRETITGGRVSIGRERSTVSGGKIESETLACRGAVPIIVADASEAGAAVKRLTPFDSAEWREWTVKSRQPIFKWEREGGEDPVFVVVAYLDSKPFRLIWQGISTDTHLTYPEDAPPLEVGMPYLVQIQHPNGRQVSAVFSVDPWVDVAHNAANRIVPLTP